MSSTSSSYDSLSLADFFKIIRSKLPLLILIVVLVVATVTLVTAFRPKWYSSTVPVRVEKPDALMTLSSSTTSSFAPMDPFFNRDQLEIIKSEKVLRKVVENLDLLPTLTEDLGIPFQREEDVVTFVQRQMVSLSARPGTSIIDITVRAQENPQLAAQVANELARVYQQDRVNFAESAQNEGLRRLEEQLNEQERLVQESRDYVEQLRQQLQIAEDIDLDNIQIEVENIRSMQSQLSDLRVSSMAMRTRWKQFADIPMDQKLLLVNSQLIGDTNILQLMGTYLGLQQDYASSQERLGENHPGLIALRTEINTIRSQLEGLLEGYERTLEINYREAEARAEGMQQELDSARAAQIDLAGGELRQFEEAVKNLRDEESVMRGIKRTLATRRADAEVPRRTTEILGVARPASTPSEPNMVLAVGLAFIGGTVLALGTAFLIELFDTSLRSVEDIERRLGYPILGVVAKKPVLVSKDSFHSFDFEPYRVIQTNLALAKVARPDAAAKERSGFGPSRSEDKQVIAFVSAGPGEGKSTTLHNLAAVMALSGQRVLVIDTDLRRPSQHDLFQLPRRPGLSEFFKSDATKEEIIQNSSVPNLDFIASGRSTHVTLSVLNSKQLSTLIEEVLPSYDKVLLDSPPIIGVSDSSVIVDKSDGVVFVVQHRRNPAPMTMRAKNILDNVAHWVYGVVLNQVPNTGDEDYNYYTSNYSHYGDLSEDNAKAPSRSRNGEEVETLGETTGPERRA